MWIETTHNRPVAGSSPAWPTMILMSYGYCQFLTASRCQWTQNLLPFLPTISSPSSLTQLQDCNAEKHCQFYDRKPAPQVKSPIIEKFSK